MENMTLFEVVKMGKSATQVGTHYCGEEIMLCVMASSYSSMVNIFLIGVVAVGSSFGNKLCRSNCIRHPERAALFFKSCICHQS